MEMILKKKKELGLHRRRRALGDPCKTWVRCSTEIFHYKQLLKRKQNTI